MTIATKPVTRESDFYRDMADRLRSILDKARVAARYCDQKEPEGCLVYEDLLELRTAIDGAVLFYATDVPACDRDSITKMVASDLSNPGQPATTDERFHRVVEHKDGNPRNNSINNLRVVDTESKESLS